MQRTSAQLVERLLAGNRRALAQTITRIENDDEARDLLAALYPCTGRAYIIGVTGAPGTGKSTLVNALARAYRGHSLTVGIIAVDPTSPFSGGALLGDRVRMRDLSGDPGIFIRSMATRGSLGGLARATADAVLALDAAGFQRIIVETVGVGQAEVDIAATAHSTVVIEAPGLGDEIQAIKAGVLEIADILVVNKADRPGAKKTVMALQMMQGMGSGQTRHHGQTRLTGQEPGQATGWQPPILETVALRGAGVAELLASIEAHRIYLKDSSLLARREVERARSALLQILQAALLRRLAERVPDQQMQRLVGQIANRDLDPYSAAEQLLPAVLLAD